MNRGNIMKREEKKKKQKGEKEMRRKIRTWQKEDEIPTAKKYIYVYNYKSIMCMKQDIKKRKMWLVWLVWLWLNVIPCMEWSQVRFQVGAHA